METGRKGSLRAVIFLIVLLLAVQACVTEACAEDPELLKNLPGRWAFKETVEKEGQEPWEAEVTLTLGEDGAMSLRCAGADGKEVRSWKGTWSSELVSDGLDRLTLLYTSTDDPQKAGSEYRVECVYNIYSESWTENDTVHTALVMEEGSHSGATPFEDMFDCDSVAMYREQGPNMRVVKCSSYVSLRAKRSKSSKRLAKVPLGALVLAFPEAGEENGFIRCIYHDQDGYILSEYLQPVGSQE